MSNEANQLCTGAMIPNCWFNNTTPNPKLITAIKIVSEVERGKSKVKTARFSVKIKTKMCPSVPLQSGANQVNNPASNEVIAVGHKKIIFGQERITTTFGRLGWLDIESFLTAGNYVEGVGSRPLVYQAAPADERGAPPHGSTT